MRWQIIMTEKGSTANRAGEEKPMTDLSPSKAKSSRAEPKGAADASRSGAATPKKTRNEKIVEPKADPAKPAPKKLVMKLKSAPQKAAVERAPAPKASPVSS